LENVSPVATDVLTKIAVPTLTITAEFDAKACLEVADLLQQHVVRNERVDIAGASHFMLMENPDEVNRVLIDFLQDQANDQR
jgi:pimeloyl-ACP methyl ester carboxylesterase